MENHLDISKNFIPYDLALELKELGFNEECIMFYRGIENELVYSFEYKRFKNSQYVDKTSISAPLWQQAFDWFREKCNLFYVIHVHREGYSFNIHTLKKGREDIFLFSTLLSSISSGNYITTYEEAELECLKKLIEIAKEQNVK